MEDIIYLDNAATTKPAPEVVEAFMPYVGELYGNPSSIYSLAMKSRAAVMKARRQAAEVIGAEPSEIYFTSGGTEADNWALIRVFEDLGHPGSHIITTKIEHHAILHTCRDLEKRGCLVTYLDVDAEGLVSPEDAEKAITPETILISVMAANNEIGTVEPIRKIAETAHAHGILFHTDAVQAYGHIPIDVKTDGIDLLSASSHKLNGPKGAGLLYIRKGLRIGSLLHGGAQERGRRAGTENVPCIVGFGAAAALAAQNMEKRAAYESALRDYMISRIEKEIPSVRLLGSRTSRLPNNVCMLLKYTEGESVLIMLDQRGICASSGSACTSGSLDPSHVVLALGISHEDAFGEIRLTISHETTKEEADRAIDALAEIAEKLRSMSPRYLMEEASSRNQSRKEAER